MPKRADCLRTATGYWLETVFYVFEYIRNGELPWAAIGNFIDDWQGSTTSNEQRQAMVVDPISDAGADPELRRWAAFCAAMTEELCTKSGIAVPAWTARPEYCLLEPWYLYPGNIQKCVPGRRRQVHHRSKEETSWAGTASSCAPKVVGGFRWFVFSPGTPANHRVIERDKRMESGYTYQILLTWSEQQQAIVAEAPELHGCTATGATYEAALAAIQEALHRWIEAIQRTGHGLPPREKRPLAEERERLLARTTEEGRQAAVESGERYTLLDETGLQVYAAQQVDAMLTTEPIETDNTAALSTSLWEAYMAGYRQAAHERGWEIQA